MASPALLRPTEEIAEFFAGGPSPEETAAFRFSAPTLTRVRALLDRSADGILTREESEELDQLVLLDRIVMLIRSRLPATKPDSAPRD